MKFLALAAVVGLAAAQLEMLSQVPQCALECFTGTIMKTDCALTDFYCQCGKNAQFIQTTTLECLCSSDCTTSDLAKVYSISNELCTKTLEAHGETYEMPPDTLTSGICHSGETAETTESTEEAAASSTSTAAAATGSSSSNSTGTAQTTGSSNGTSSSSPKATSSTADFTGAAASGFGMSVAAIAIGGLAFMI